MKTAQPNPTKLEERRAAMMAIVGLWKDRTDLPDTETYIRNLRKSSHRLERLQALRKSQEEVITGSHEELVP
jgi:methyl coenzyme M reductase subunit C-like uncharacterized protein (methanogenesis marker protein 7)